MSDFKIPPISTLMGSQFGNILKVLKTGEIDRQFYFKVTLTLLLSIVASPLYLWEQLRFGSKLKQYKQEKPPLFILGHWRSGTTFLHNLLCQDPEASYLTTYHSLFPNNLASKAIFKTFMRLNMPNKRPSDNVTLNIDFPQEDEFAVGNSTLHSYYSFFYFPKSYKRYYEESVLFNLPEKEKEEWKKSYAKLLKKADLNTKGKRLVVKNPVNTARIKTLLEIYPDAKFLYIHRNPVTVYLSVSKFFKALFPTLWLQKVSPDFIDSMILEIYVKLMSNYESQKALIPEKNLMEIKFEDFENQPLIFSKEIYETLLGEDYNRVSTTFATYVNSMKSYKKNRYKVKQETFDQIKRHWGEFMDLYGYELPDDIDLQ